MQQSTILAMVRIVTGLLVAYHGLEVFDSAKMSEYASWDSIKALPVPSFWAYAGKGAELLGGILLSLGFFTRIAAASVAGVMLFICFYIGKGKFWYEDQHSFLFVVIASIYLFSGAGKWSIDQMRKSHT